MKTVFSVEGPFEVPCYQGKASRIVTEENADEFWAQYTELGRKRGCYVFGIRAGKGFTPGYVGKATKSFGQEVFTHHKLTRYQLILADYLRGTPILYFLCLPKKAGKPNESHMGQLEKFLIQVGVAANPDLLNIKGTKMEEWGITGVLRGGHGKPKKSARSFAQMMKIR